MTKYVERFEHKSLLDFYPCHRGVSRTTKTNHAYIYRCICIYIYLTPARRLYLTPARKSFYPFVPFDPKVDKTGGGSVIWRRAEKVDKKAKVDKRTFGEMINPYRNRWGS